MLNESRLLKQLKSLEIGRSGELSPEQQTAILDGLKKVRKGLTQRIKRSYNVDRLIAYKGSSCERCGGRFHNCVYDFHHYDPSAKGFKLDRSNMGRSYEALKDEVDKCRLLCANCHRQVHEFLEPEFIVVLPPGVDTDEATL